MAKMDQIPTKVGGRLAQVHQGYLIACECGHKTKRCRSEQLAVAEWNKQ
jgi:hypothetical protein